MRWKMPFGLLVSLSSIGCLTKSVRQLGYVQEDFAGVDEIRASDTFRELVIDYEVFLVEDQENLGEAGETTVAAIKGGPEPRRLIVPYDHLPIFEYVGLEGLTQEKVQSLLHLAQNRSDMALGPYGTPYSNPCSFEPPALSSKDALGGSLSVEACSIPIWEGDFYDLTCDDWRSVAALLREEKALVGHGMVVLTRNQTVYVFRLPLQVGDLPWAMPARFALYPLATTFDFVVMPACVVAAYAAVITLACVAANPDLPASIAHFASKRKQCGSMPPSRGYRDGSRRRAAGVP